VSEEVNRKCPARNKTVDGKTSKLPTPTLSATVHSVTDRRTDDSIMPIADRIALLRAACSKIG